MPNGSVESGVVRHSVSHAIWITSRRARPLSKAAERAEQSRPGVGVWLRFVPEADFS